MNKIIVTKSGRRVYKNYLDNIVCTDKTNKALVNKATSGREKFSKGIAKGLSRFGSEVSEDALTWSVFRSLEINSAMDIFFNLLGIKDELEESIFWTTSTKTERADAGLNRILCEVEPKAQWSQQTEPDVVLRCKNHLIFIESKLGTPKERVTGWARKQEFNEKHKRYQHFLSEDFQTVFSDNFNILGKKYYQLMRNIIIGRRLANVEGKKFLFVALVNSLSRPCECVTHLIKFHEFLPNLNDPTIAKFITWQEIEGAIPENEIRLEQLKMHLKNHLCLV